MKGKKIMALLLLATVTMSMFTGCGKGEDSTSVQKSQEVTKKEAKEIKEFTAFFAVSHESMPEQMLRQPLHKTTMPGLCRC